MSISRIVTDTLSTTFLWFQKAVPNPDRKTVSVQLGVHFEEVAEMLAEIKGEDDASIQFIENAENALVALSDALKTGECSFLIKSKIAMLDAICDQIVTATGTGYMLDMNVVSALDEVNSSNYSKFVDGIPQFNEMGKIAKGKDYRKPNLEPFI